MKMKSANLAAAYVKNILMANLSGKHTLDTMVATYYVTQLCNFRCNYCEDFSADRNEEYKPTEVNTDTAKRIIEIVRKDCDVLYLTGGEPLLRNDIEEIVRFAVRDLGFTYVGMNTNGLLLPRREGVLDHLHNIVISLDGTDPKRLDYVWGTPDGTAAKVLQIIARYARDKNGRKYTVTVNCVAGPDTVDECESVMEFCFEHGIEFTMSPQNIDVQPHPSLRKNDRYKRFVERILKEKKAGQPVSGSAIYYEHMLEFTPFQCYPTLSARIDPQGQVSFPCRPLEYEGKAGGMAGNLLEAGSLKKLMEIGKQRWGETITCHDRCYLRCHAEMSLLVRNPTKLFAETAGYLYRTVFPKSQAAMPKVPESASTKIPLVDQETIPPPVYTNGVSKSNGVSKVRLPLVR